MSKLLQARLAALAVTASAGAANAAMDTAAITAGAADIAAVGGAVFAILVGIKVVKWVRRAL